MPMISIETKKETHGYSISAENTIWCHHGILSNKQLRQSEDEDLIADIAASILSDSPIARSKELLDSIYDIKNDKSQKIESELRKYESKKLQNQIKGLFSLIDDTVKKHNPTPKVLRKIVMGERSTASSMKTPFYSIFMAFYELVIKENKSPENIGNILEALSKVNKKLDVQTHHATLDQRKKNISMVKRINTRIFCKKRTTTSFSWSRISHGF